MPSCKAFGPWEHPYDYFWCRRSYYGGQKHTQLVVQRVLSSKGIHYRIHLFGAFLSDTDLEGGVDSKLYATEEEALAVADEVAIRAGFELHERVSRFEHEEVV